MAVEEIITRYSAQVDGYIAEIEKIKKEVKTLTDAEKKSADDQKKNVTTLTQAAQQRNALLKQEQATLKQLELQRKQAFAVKDIEAYNTKIAATKRNIDLLKGSTGELNNISNTLKSSFAGIGLGIAGAFSAVAISAFLKDSVRAFREAEVSANQLKFAVVSIGNEGVQSFQRLLAQSERLQDVSIFTGGDIQRTQKQLIQFGLTGDEVEKLIPKILDLAAASGKTLGEAADTVIQGINGQTRALKPLGLEFKNTGDKAENLAIITDKLNKFTGASAELLNTSAGKAANLANTFDDLKEKIGGLIANSDIFKGFTNSIDAFIRSFKSLDDLRAENLTGDIALKQKNINNEIQIEIDKRLKLAGVQITTAEKIKELSDDVIRKDTQLTEAANKRLATGKDITDEEIKRQEAGEAELEIAKKLLEVEKQKKLVTDTSVKKVGGQDVVKPEIEAEVRLNVLKEEQIRIEKTLKELSASPEILQQRRLELVAVKQLIAAENSRGKTNLGLTPDEQAKREAAAVTEANKAREDEIKLREKINELRAKGIADPVKSLEAQAKTEIEKELAQSKATEETKAEFVKARTLALANAIYKIKIDNAQKISDEEIKILEASADEQDKFFREQLDERVKAEKDAQDAVNAARIAQFKNGSIGQLNVQKTILGEIRDENLKNIDRTETDEKIAAQKKLAINQKYADDVGKINDEIKEKQIQNLKDVVAITTAVFDGIVTLANARSQKVIDAIQKEGDAQLEVYDKDLEALQTQRDKKLISESTFETKSAAIKQQRVDAEKRIAEAIAKEQRKAAELAKILAIFKATLAVAVALAELNYVGAALAAVELGVIIATPIPAFKLGSKKVPKTGVSLVGEEGEELRVLNQGDKIVPHRQTKKYRDAADAMIDDTFDEFIFKTYVQPFIRIEQAKENTFENAINNSKQIKNIMDSRVIDTSTHADYNYTFHKNYITNTIEKAQRQIETNKQKSFAESIAQSFVNNTTVTNNKVSGIDQLALFKQSKQKTKVTLVNSDEIGKSIAKHLNDNVDYRHL